MTFVDSNVPMYLVGARHPHKVNAQALLERAIAAGETLLTSSEVLQEILHRYAAIGRLDAIRPCFDLLLGVVDSVLPIESDDVIAARGLVTGGPRLPARDAIHVAVMKRHGIRRIFSFDAHFDRVRGLERVAEA